jgi:DNA-binding XRE family transcriptional regulator
VYPFTNNSNSTKTAYKIEVPLIIQPPNELIEEPVTLGDHLRRRRLELGLYQKDVAAKIGVTTSTIWNWEHNWTIDPRYIPLVIEFLGYNPILCPKDLLDRLAWYKLVNGLPLEELGAVMERDPEQLADWLSGRHDPCRKNRERIEKFLTDRHVW